MMKLGKHTGSLVNHIYSRSTTKEPITIGMGCTLLSWSDRHPATVIDIFTKGKFSYVAVQDDDAKRIDTNGISESQDYEYTRNPNGAIRYFRLKNDTWESVYIDPDTNRFKKGCGSICFGIREEYYDYSF